MMYSTYSYNAKTMFYFVSVETVLIPKFSDLCTVLKSRLTDSAVYVPNGLTDIELCAHCGWSVGVEFVQHTRVLVGVGVARAGHQEQRPIEHRLFHADSHERLQRARVRLLLVAWSGAIERRDVDDGDVVGVGFTDSGV